MNHDSIARQWALRHSATCFFNSLAREESTTSLVAAPVGVPGPRALRLPLADESTLFVPVVKQSLVGRHRYGEGFFRLHRNGDLESLDFLQAAKAVTESLAASLGTDEKQRRLFLSRVENSVANIATVLRSRGLDLAGLHRHGRVDFRSAEQALFLGHNFHPTPKSRDEFSADDFRKYSSEMGAEFPLHWFLVKPEILHIEKSSAFRDDEFARDLFRKAFPDRADLQARLDEGYEPLPVHPWQKERLLQRQDIAEHLRAGRLIDAGASADRWTATTSTRSIHNPRAKYMLKFSLSVRLTNSLRHLLPAEVVRGLQVHDVFATEAGRRFQAENPRFGVLFEPAFAALKGADGKPVTESVVVWRENPFRETSDTQDIVLATLVQEHPFFGENLLLSNVRRWAENEGLDLGTAAREWFDAYLETVVRPLVNAQSRYGVLMGAHQQNLILRLRDHRPVAAFFRDCQGTGYSRRGFDLFARDVALIDEKNGNVLDGVSGNTLFSYYLIVNSTFNVIASLAARDWVQEHDLLARLRDFLQEIVATAPADVSCLEALLREPTILQKGNFLCAFRGVNENTAANPLALYDRIPNPLALGRDGSPDLSSSAKPTLKAFGKTLYRTPLDGVERQVSFDGSELTAHDGKISLRLPVEGAGPSIMVSLSAGPDLLVLTAIEALLGHHPEIRHVRLKGTLPAEGLIAGLFGRRDDGTDFHREEFFQIPHLWMPRNTLLTGLERWTVTNEVAHPRRPCQEGILYRRFVPSLGRTLSFRRIDTDRDLDLFHAWQTQARVARFWELDQPKEVLAEFLRKTLADPHTTPTVLEVDGEPVGYFEIYWVAEDRLAAYCDARPFDRGFHLLIGNEKFLGFRNTDAALKSVAHFMLLDEPRTRTLWAEPRADNAAVLKYIETFVAWRKLREFDFPHKRAALLECRRENFFGGNYL